ncbi:MAG: right-handed parallel beta-helix repeat-containing protein [Planctomycetes bacterium]|nr:right-handed parallel beta-helix repeat-containing protein [Planctomycetota bacterium]
MRSPCSSVLLAVLLLAPSAVAGTRYVNVGLTTGANNGNSWADAHRGVDGVAVALSAAAAGDQIWVASGTYKPTAAGLRGATHLLRNNIEVLGGFAGFETSALQRDPGANPTILSGDLAGNDGSGILTDNSFHVLSGAGTNATAVLDGFTVRAGNANGAGANEDRGGGILCVAGASPTIRLCFFVANRCSFGGGAGYINSSSPTFTDCHFDANFGGSFGGAFDMATNVGATFERCRFTNNSASRAGAIEIFGASTVKVYNSLFVNNTATGGSGGGGMFIAGSSPQIRNCTVVGNWSPANATAGILSSGATPSIVNCVIHGNFGAGGATGVTAQIAPAGLAVSYSLVVGYAGTGNVNVAPVFETCGTSPQRLAPNSPGVDAGNNAALPPASTLDLVGAARYTDDPNAPDTGLGSAPIVDIGAFEASADCNGNGVADPCDIAGGASSDLNGNGIPDECDCQGGSVPVSYCTAKTNSQGCLPAIAAAGVASVSSPLSFVISAAPVLNNKAGLLLYGFQAGAAPFQGGVLCIGGPIRRSPGLHSGGNPPGGGLDCSGVLSMDFNAFLQSGAVPALLVVGQQVNVQYWSRDPGDAFGTNTTNALQFGICQ